MLGRVPIPEVSGPAAQECIDVPHDRFSIDEQPVPVGELTNPVPGMLHGLVRGPAGQELNRPTSIPGAGAHQPVVEAEEVEAFPGPPAGARSASWPPSAPVRVRPTGSAAAAGQPRPVP